MVTVEEPSTVEPDVEVSVREQRGPVVARAQVEGHGRSAGLHHVDEEEPLGRNLGARGPRLRLGSRRHEFTSGGSASSAATISATVGIIVSTIEFQVLPSAVWNVSLRIRSTRSNPA